MLTKTLAALTLMAGLTAAPLALADEPAPAPAKPLIARPAHAKKLKLVRVRPAKSTEAGQIQQVQKADAAPAAAEK